MKFSENSFTTPFMLPPGLDPVLTETGELTSPLDLQLNWKFLRLWFFANCCKNVWCQSICYFVVHWSLFFIIKFGPSLTDKILEQDEKEKLVQKLCYFPFFLFYADFQLMQNNETKFIKTIYFLMSSFVFKT